MPLAQRELIVSFQANCRVGTLFVFIEMLAVSANVAVHAQDLNPNCRKPVTVGDAIGMTQFASRRYSLAGSSSPEVALFSPDNRQFVVVLKKGNLERNTNDFSILLFSSSEALSLPKAETLLTWASSSNSEAISDVKWLDDNRTLVFIGERLDETPQIYS